MPTETHTTDAKAGIFLPKTFANTTVIIEQISDTEVRIRKAEVIARDELPFAAPVADFLDPVRYEWTEIGYEIRQALKNYSESTHADD